MNRIKVINLIPKAFSNEQASVLRDEIKKLLDAGAQKIEIDFSGITVFTTLFFNFSTGVFINEMGKEKYDKGIENAESIANDVADIDYILSQMGGTLIT